MKKIIFTIAFTLFAVLGFSQNSSSKKDYSSLILGSWKLREADDNGANKGFSMYGDEYFGTTFYNKNGSGTHISLYKTSWKIDGDKLIEKMVEDNGSPVTHDIWIKYSILKLDDETLELKVLERNGDTNYRIDGAPRLVYKRK